MVARTRRLVSDSVARVLNPHYPKNRNWSAWKPFVLSLSKHERLPCNHQFGEHSKIPFALSLSKGGRDFGMLNCGF